MLEEVLHDAEASQQADGIGSHHQPGAHLRELRGLLVDRGHQPRTVQEGAGRQATDTTTHDCDPWDLAGRHADQPPLTPEQGTIHNNAENYKVELLASGAIQCTFQGSASRHNATGGSGLNNGVWHHVQCIKTSSQIKTVVDGKVVGTTTGAVGSISNTSGLDIGAHPGSDWYHGGLDEVSIAFG
jgi:Concanavalin A-like lectin/glucanases superfamily